MTDSGAATEAGSVRVVPVTRPRRGPGPLWRHQSEAAGPAPWARDAWERPAPQPDLLDLGGPDRPLRARWRSVPQLFTSTDPTDCAISRQARGGAVRGRLVRRGHPGLRRLRPDRLRRPRVDPGRRPLATLVTADHRLVVGHARRATTAAGSTRCSRGSIDIFLGIPLLLGGDRASCRRVRQQRQPYVLSSCGKVVSCWRSSAGPRWPG